MIINAANSKNIILSKKKADLKYVFFLGTLNKILHKYTLICQLIFWFTDLLSAG